MTEILQPSSFDPINIIETSRITADAAAGQKVVIVENPSGISANVYAVMGNLAAENAELMQVDTIVGSTVTFTENLANKHYDNEPITILYANQVKIYRAANVDGTMPADGSFAAIGSPVTIQADQAYVEYTDISGGSSYWYKKTYYNSFSTNQSDLSLAVAIRGGGYGHYTNIDAVRSEAGISNNRYIDNSFVYQKMIMAESEVNGSLVIGGYTLPLTTIPNDVVNATNLLAAGYILANDYGPEHSGTSKDGERKIKLAREILARIEKHETSLVDSTGTAIANTSRILGYPDETAEGLSPSEGPLFRITDKL